MRMLCFLLLLLLLLLLVTLPAPAAGAALVPLDVDEMSGVAAQGLIVAD